MIKVIDDKVIQLKDYPININNTSYMIIKEGNFHKYNFIIKSQLTKFPGQYVKQMNKLANMGPFVLEVKKNGNVIYYQKNNPSEIMWQTNTANKGKGPYNFYLTNDKKLILEDSNGDILYKYDSYIDIPTINYGKGINGLFYKENDNNPINPKTFKITIDNKDLQIKWNLAKKTSPTSSFESPRTTVFTSNIIGNNQNIDICYAARIFEYQWTGFGCNGELVGARLNYIGPKKYVNATSDNIYITNLIIYIKPKNEDIPKINNSPKLMQFNVGY